jgi:HSP20 family protein
MRVKTMTLYSFPMTAQVAPAGMRREMDRLVQEVFGNDALNGGGMWSPATDGVEDATGFTLELEIPGIAPDAVELVAEDGVLIVRGEKTRAALDEGQRAFLGERVHGAFERRFRLPKSADLSAIEARYAHGVLTVRIAKVAPAQPRRVPITVDSGPVATTES